MPQAPQAEPQGLQLLHMLTQQVGRQVLQVLHVLQELQVLHVLQQVRGAQQRVRQQRRASASPPTAKTSAIALTASNVICFIIFSLSFRMFQTWKRKSVRPHPLIRDTLSGYVLDRIVPRVRVGRPRQSVKQPTHPAGSKTPIS
jgi:hypothetical protein